MRRRPGQAPQIVALLMLVVALVAVLLLKGRCGATVGGYFESLDEPARPAR